MNYYCTELLMLSLNRGRSTDDVSLVMATGLLSFCRHTAVATFCRQNEEKLCGTAEAGS